MSYTKISQDTHFGTFTSDQDFENSVWYEQNSNQELHIVGSKKANKWGIHDNIGNVSEIVFDNFPGYPSYVKMLKGGDIMSYLKADMRPSTQTETAIDYPEPFSGLRLVFVY